MLENISVMEVYDQWRNLKCKEEDEAKVKVAAAVAWEDKAWGQGGTVCVHPVEPEFRISEAILATKDPVLNVGLKWFVEI